MPVGSLPCLELNRLSFEEDVLSRWQAAVSASILLYTYTLHLVVMQNRATNLLRSSLPSVIIWFCGYSAANC